MAIDLPLYFWIALGLAACGLLALAVFRRLSWWPAWVLRILLAGAVLAGIFYPRPETHSIESVAPKEVLVVDFSDSILLAEASQMAQFAQDWQKAQPGRSLVGVAAGAAPLLDASAHAQVLDGRGSDLKSGLELAARLLGDQAGQIYLATDGQAPGSAEIKSVLTEITKQGHPIAILPLKGRDRSIDGFIGPIQAPSKLWENTPFDVVVPVIPPDGGRLEKLNLVVNGQVSQAQAQPLDGQRMRIPLPPQAQGIITLEVSADFRQASGDPDAFSENNQSYAVLQVFASPRVLFVSDDAARDAHLIAVLKQTKLALDVLSPDQLPTSLDKLQEYKVILLSNFLANKLSGEQMISLQVFVSDQGGGLVFLGGRNSYTLGGYKNTLLEPILPVKLEPPPRPQRPPMVFTLILDSSDSMSGVDPKTTPINLAKEAAIRAVESLKAQDYISLLAFTEKPGWVVHSRLLGDGLQLRQVLDSISGIEANGGTRMYRAMTEALDELAKLPSGVPSTRHVLILSDGNSTDGTVEEFAALARKANQSQNITISTIALGSDADIVVMKRIAAEGKGRFYIARDAAELPRIMIAESQAGRSDNIQSGDILLKAGIADHPLMFGLSEKDLPKLKSYNALASKKEAGAEDILVSSPYSDPVLSGWQYGLGRVVTWMGDAGQEWVGVWPSEALETNFWQQVIRYSLPNPAIQPIQAEVQVKDTQIRIDAALVDARSNPVNLAEVTFTYADLQGKVHSLNIPQVGPGAYSLETARPEAGAYRGVLTYQMGQAPRQEAVLPFAVDVPAEWQPASTGAGAAALADWITVPQVGQTNLAGLGVSQSAASLPKPVSAESVEEILKYVLLALVVGWPLEIAIRRRWLSWNHK